jgi:predicted TIM-barrel fold metal-dependent hydrolase
LIVDTHVHVVGDELQYPLNPSGLGTNWFREVPVSVDEFAKLMDEAGVGRAVLVQAMGAYGFDNDYVLDAAASDPSRFKSVVIVDVAGDPAAAAATLRAVAIDRGATGVRLFALGDDWVGAPEAAPIWRAAADLGLLVVATLLAPQLPSLALALDRYPEVPVALDHCGFPDLSGGPPFPNAEPLLALSDRANLHLKVSCHVLEQLADPADLVDRLAGVFGAERLMWGSDFPQTHDRPYPALVELGGRACARLPPPDQAEFLAGTAMKLTPW